ncbi:MAG: DNA translocase FtsK [Flavobacteriia bacterium]|nr:DNA translocase FtsK [Flavobacteriia bacterium]
MEENEYIPRSNSKPTPKSEEPISSRSKKEGEEPKRSKENKNTSREKSNASGGGLKERLNLPKIKIFIGALLSLMSIYLFLACVSYLFTWTKDQDQLLNRGFVEYIFNSELPAVENWLGKFGAWTSHLLIHRGFGIPSFGLIFSLLPLARTTSVTISYMIWGSIFLGFFSPQISFAGGSFGFYTNEWLQLTFGGFGTLFMHVIAFFVLTTLQFSPNYRALLNRIFGSGAEGNEEEQLSAGDNAAPYDDIYVVNTIKEDQIKTDDIAQTVVFDDSDDEDVFEEESELIVQVSNEEPAEPIKENYIESDFEIELGDDPVVEAPFQAPIADEDLLATQLVSEHGEYDPTKDLEGYLLPPLELMKDYVSSGVSVSKEELETNKDRIVETLSHYKIDIAKIKATVGPTVTLYEIVPAPGVRISKIKNLEDDIALSLSALGIRIIAPIPGKGTIGIEVPNSNPEMVSMRSLIASDKFQHFDGELPIVMGKTITNETFVFDLTKMPHLLVAGATGQGKSVGLNAILISILYKKHPAQVKFVLVDPKKVELTLYNKIERHFLAKLPGEEDAIITDTSKVVNTLNSLCIEMDERYELLKDAGVRTIKEYNAKFTGRRLNPEKGHRYLPYIVVLIDEFADLIMTAGKEVEHPIARIAQLARAIGIHLIVATQRPSVNVITGMIKANFPARIAFRVLSKIDSRTILDASGADQLIGRGDMLITTGSEMKRLQCGFVDTPEVEDICSFIGSQRAYPEALILPEYVPEGSEANGEIDMNEIDNMFVDSARIVVINQQGSASLLQRKLKLGYNRAGRIVDQLEGMNIIGPFQGSKAREVLFSDVESLDEYLRAKGLL